MKEQYKIWCTELKIIIKTENAAFGNTDEELTTEVVRILRKLADNLETNGYSPSTIPVNVMDINGNKVCELVATRSCMREV